MSLDTEVSSNNDEDLAFAAAYAEARGEEPPAEQVVEEETQDQTEQESEAVDEDQPAAEEEKPVIAAGLTDEQLTALLARVPKIDDLEASTSKRMEQVFGKFGEMQRTINELKNGGSGQPVRISKEQLKRTFTEYPEMAEMLAEDLSEALKMGGGSSFDQAQFDERLAQREAAIREESTRVMEAKLLTLAHRDWEKVVSSDEFSVWKQTQDQETQDALSTSWDSLYLSDKISEFKGWQDKSKNISSLRKERLSAAVTPQSTPSTGPTVQSEDDAMAAAFNNIRQARAF